MKAEAGILRAPQNPPGLLALGHIPNLLQKHTEFRFSASFSSPSPIGIPAPEENTAFHKVHVLYMAHNAVSRMATDPPALNSLVSLLCTSILPGIPM